VNGIVNRELSESGTGRPGLGYRQGQGFSFLYHFQAGSVDLQSKHRGVRFSRSENHSVIVSENIYTTSVRFDA
jgi:hypothetical protein